MSESLLRSPGYLVYFAFVTFYAAILANSGCDAQFLIDNGGGLGVLPPGLRLSQTLQQVRVFSLCSVIQVLLSERKTLTFNPNTGQSHILIGTLSFRSILRDIAPYQASMLNVSRQFIWYSVFVWHTYCPVWLHKGFERMRDR